jgi:hypothetical protein
MSSPRALAPILALLALTLAGPAAAAPPRIAIAPIRGDAGGRLGAQLKLALCRAQRCVPGALTGSHPRLDRARRMRVEAAVFAAIRRERGRKEVAVRLETTAGRPLGSWRLPVGRDRAIPPEHLVRLSDEVEATLRPPSRHVPRPAAVPREAPAPPAPRVVPAPAPAQPMPAPAREPEPEAATAWAQAPAVAEDGEPPDPTSVPPAPSLTAPDAQIEAAVPRQRPGAPAPRARTEVPLPPPPRLQPRTDAEPLPPLFTGEDGIDVARRGLRFPGGSEETRRPVGYSVNLHVTPRLRVELHPLRSFGPGLAAVGVFAEGAYLPSSQVSTPAQTFKVGYLRLRAGALSRFQVTSGVVLTPSLAWEIERLTLRKPDGDRFPGLPDSVLGGPSLGLDLEVAVASRIKALATVRGIYWLQAGELAGGYFFYPGGNAFGLELEAGVAVRLIGPVSIRVGACYAATRWSLEPDPTGAYTVSSATADSVSGRAWIRLEL